ncbi:MAG: ribosome maturation factor RimM [Eubacteriales bacterium]|nr:ribosome maturation factor RimM [Eubacteriales bacterium]
MNKELRVGVIVKTHGIRGEVKVYPTTDSPMRFNEITDIKLKLGKKVKQLKIEDVHYFKNLAILKFEGLDRIEDVEAYKGAELYVSREDATELSEDEYYIADLIDIEVYSDEGKYIGRLKDVLETGANDVYIVSREDDKDLLLPAIHDCIKEINIEENKMTVHIMDGLLDL